MKRATKNRIITIFIALIFIGSTAAFSILSSFENIRESYTNWKAQIIIVIYGEQYPIPSNIGIENNKTKAKVYTGNTNGIIYKTVSEDITLKDFFDTWGQTFNSTCILEYCNTNTSSLAMYVWQGNKWVENFDYEYYKINNNDIILIDYR
ncbi:MAG: hypothetical protein QXD43_01505 [Candidatus Aenigmatarchaeota archaeon]